MPSSIIEGENVGLTWRTIQSYYNYCLYIGIYGTESLYVFIFDYTDFIWTDKVDRNTSEHKSGKNLSHRFSPFLL